MRYGVAHIVAVVAIFGSGTGWAQDAPKPFPPALIKAWRRGADASVGWMKRSDIGLDYRSGAAGGKPGEVPTFVVGPLQPGELLKLPVPSQPFGISFRDIQSVDGTHLNQLAGFKSL